MSNQEELRGQIPTFSYPVNAVGPNLSIPELHDGDQGMGSYQFQQQDTHPAMFGQNQLKDGFGPVYAIPSYPSQNGQSQGIGNFQGQQQDTHPALFDQNQLKNGFGPVYAIPTYPWHHSNSQDTGSNPSHHHGQSMGDGQQRSNHQQTMIPYCWYTPCYMYPLPGHQYYR